MPALWSEVNRYGQNGDFTRALKPSTRVSVRIAPGGWEDAAPCDARDRLRADAGRGDPSRPLGPERPAGGGRRPFVQPGQFGSRVFRATCTSPLAPPSEKRGRDLVTAAPSVFCKLFLFYSVDFTPYFANTPRCLFRFSFL